MCLRKSDDKNISDENWNLIWQLKHLRRKIFLHVCGIEKKKYTLVIVRIIWNGFVLINALANKTTGIF